MQNTVSLRVANREAAHSTRGLALVIALAVAVIFAQSLALTHRFSHGIAHGHAEQTSRADGLHSGSASGGFSLSVNTEPGVLAQLFSDHEDGSVDCRAFDSLTHVDVLPSLAVMLLPLVVPAFLLALLPGLATARWHALFQARGPPSLR